MNKSKKGVTKKKAKKKDGESIKIHMRINVNVFDRLKKKLKDLTGVQSSAAAASSFIMQIEN